MSLNDEERRIMVGHITYKRFFGKYYTHLSLTLRADYQTVTKKVTDMYNILRKIAGRADMTEEGAIRLLSSLKRSKRTFAKKQ